jgi:serine/threonine-protein kinase
VLGHWWPDPLPGNRWILFTAFRTPVDTSLIGAVNLETREIRRLVDGGFFGRYVPTGHLIYAKEQRLYAVPFDAASVTTKGKATPVVDDVLVEQTGGFAMADVSIHGTLAYVPESVGHPPNEIVWLDRSGTPAPAVGEKHRYLSASLSPDGSRVALTVLGDSRDLWIYSFDRGTLSRLTSGEDTEFDPVWSKDGRELFYVVDSPPFELHRIVANAPDSGQPVWKERAERDTLTPAVSPDGSTIVFTLNEEETGTNIYTRPLDGSKPARPFRVTRSAEDYPSFSPDGRWLAYNSDETGRPEVYVETFPGPGERYQISANGGREPRWARNGEIFFRSGDELRVVSTRLAAGFEFDTERVLFNFPILPHPSGGVSVRVYDVSSDGRRILAITTPAALRPHHIEIVTDWTSELARLVPTR